MKKELELGIYLNGTNLVEYKPSSRFKVFIPTYVNRSGKTGDTYVEEPSSKMVDFCKKVFSVDSSNIVQPMYWFDLKKPDLSYIIPSSLLRSLAYKHNLDVDKIQDELDCENRVVNVDPKSEVAKTNIHKTVKYALNSGFKKMHIDGVPHIHPTVKKTVKTFDASGIDTYYYSQFYAQYNTRMPTTFEKIWRTTNYIDYGIKMYDRRLPGRKFDGACLNVFHNNHPYHKQLDPIIRELFDYSIHSPEKLYNRASPNLRSLICFLTSFDRLSYYTNKINLFSELWLNHPDNAYISEYIYSGKLHDRYLKSSGAFDTELAESTLSFSLTVTQIQQLLVSLDYDLGHYGNNKDGVDGIFGERTSAAIYFFELEHDLQPDGLPDNKLYLKLIDAYQDKYHTYPEFL